MEEMKWYKAKLSRCTYFRHDEIIARLGGSLTKFQKLAYIACLISFSTEAYLIYNLAFLNFLPSYTCSNGVDPPFACTREMTCTPAFNHLVSETSKSGYTAHSPDTGILLHNWIQDMNLRCSDAWQIGLFGSIFFIGHVTGSTLLSEYGDTIGRIPMLRLGQGISAFAYLVIVMVTRNIYVIYGLMFVFGMLSCCRGNLGFIYG